MQKFDFYYGLHLAHKLYSITDYLSAALQAKVMPAVTGQRIARKTISVLKGMRKDEDANLFFDDVKQRAGNYPDIGEPSLGRNRSRNPEYSGLMIVDGYHSTVEPFHHESSSSKYRQIYFKVIDFIISSLNERFMQKSIVTSRWNNCSLMQSTEER